MWKTQWVNDSHTKIVYLTDTVREFDEKILSNSRSTKKPSYSKISSSIFENIEKNQSARL
jgi:hypothetical protein